MTRITYKKVNKLLTSKPMLANQELLIVTINPEALEAVITSINTALPKAALKSPKDLTDLKKLVRKELEKQGVIFKDEVRPGRKLKQEAFKNVLTEINSEDK